MSSINIRSLAGSGRHWDKAAAFAVLAALGPVVMLALQAGTAARAWAFISGAKVEPSPKMLFGPGADLILWAWVVFFLVLALVYAVEAPPRDEYEKFAAEACGDFVIPEPESASESAPELRIAVPEAPLAADGESAVLPTVHSLPEAQAWFKKGGELYAQRRYEEAISRFDRALKIYPRLAKAWAGKGLANNAIGQTQEAVLCFDEALRLDPRDPAFWHDKGNVLSSMGRLEGALSCYNEALVLDARDAGAWNNKGVCLAALGRPEEAIACCDRALALDPTYAVAWQAKGLIEERLGHLPEAIAAYKQFIELSQDREKAAVEKVRRHVAALQAGSQRTT